MWWSRQDRHRAFTRPAAAAVLVGIALGLSACGFRPLYEAKDDPAMAPIGQMAAIQIAPLPDRMGQQMHNLLRDRLNPAGQPLEPAYTLDIRLSESRTELGIRKDETATRANLNLSAQFTLNSTQSGSRLYSDRVRSVSSYNILTSPFATDFAEDDARARALRELADAIQTRLGIFFSRKEEDTS
jgi:LPS-assembly lipoprotein